LILVRNHEQGAMSRGTSAYGPTFERLDRVALDRLFDVGTGREPMLGGTTIARNLYNDSELTGVCFAPDGKTLFVNIQTSGSSFAITGPFRAHV
jgi:hypothetical protein